MAIISINATVYALQTSKNISSYGVISKSIFPLKGINYGWNDCGGAWISNWLSTLWNETKVRSDFAEMESMGIQIVRVYPGDVQWINWDDAWDKGYQGFNEYIVNVDKLFEIARDYGMKIIFVIHFADCFRWSALTCPAQRQSYLNLMRDLAQRYKGEGAMYSFDLFNEPYWQIEKDEPSWWDSPSEANVTAEVLHEYLQDCYLTIKNVSSERLVSVGEGGGPGGMFDKYFNYLMDISDYAQIHVYEDPDWIEQNGLKAQTTHYDEITKPIILAECGAAVPTGHLWDTAINAEALQKIWEEANKLGLKAILPWSFVDDNIINSITHEWYEGAYVIQNWSRH